MSIVDRLSSIVDVDVDRPRARRVLTTHRTDAPTGERDGVHFIWTLNIHSFNHER